MSAYKLDIQAAGKAAYETYFADHLDIATWDVLTAPERAQWVAVASAVSASYNKLADFSDAEKTIVSEAIQYGRGLGDLSVLEAYTPNRLTVIARMARVLGILR